MGGIIARSQEDGTDVAGMAAFGHLENTGLEVSNSGQLWTGLTKRRLSSNED
jgi:hypothetical protein